MNALNGIVNAIFDFVCRLAASVGSLTLLILLSGVFGVLALVAFKHLSFQKRIKAAKDKIKAHMIEIRLYQDDLAIVGRAIGKVFWHNARYLGLNIVPILPLALPFTIVAAQLVTRFGFEPAPVHAQTQPLLAGGGTTLAIELQRGEEGRIANLEVHYPAGLEPVSPLVRMPESGKAWQEFVARKPGCYTIEIALDGETQTKQFCAGVAAPQMQPERGRGFVSALLWPAEPVLESRSFFKGLSFRYPDRKLPWMPAGPEGVLLYFLLVSMLFGLAVMKPLKVQI
ncbi:MAG: hypothetical protein IPJ19_04975 [Planctomycetes bacterium]|nr:hypothetical protein [Planctomycetota bacterium]